MEIYLKNGEFDGLTETPEHEEIKTCSFCDNNAAVIDKNENHTNPDLYCYECFKQYRQQINLFNIELL